MPAKDEAPAYPEFAELCRTARDMEKQLLMVKPAKMSDSLNLLDISAIFPKEFEDYTFAYALSEAQKVERKLFSSNYQTALSAKAPEGQAQSPKPSEMSERQIESELHKLEASGEPELARQKIAEPKRPGEMSVGPFRLPAFPFGKKKAEQAAKTEAEDIQLRRPTGLPSEIQFAADTEAAAREKKQESTQSAPLPPPQQSDWPGINIPFISRKSPVPKELPVQVPPPEPEWQGVDGEAAEKEAGLKFGEGIHSEAEEKPDIPVQSREIKPPALNRKTAVPDIPKARWEIAASPKQDKGEEKEISSMRKETEQPGPEKGDEPETASPESEGEKEIGPGQQKPQSAPFRPGIAPRLREIIEERLKKEEENAKKESEEEAKAPQMPAPEEEDGREEEEIILSGRQRMQKRRGKEAFAAQQELEARKEEEERVQKRKDISSEQEELKGQGGEKEEPEALREIEKEGPGQREEPEAQQEEPESGFGNEEVPSRAKGRRKEEEELGAMLPASPGGMTIQPIFSDRDEGDKEAEAPKKKGALQETATEEARLRRIQKIIGDLSADKYKAAAIPKKIEPGEGEDQVSKKKRVQTKVEIAEEPQEAAVSKRKKPEMPVEVPQEKESTLQEVEPLPSRRPPKPQPGAKFAKGEKGKTIKAGAKKKGKAKEKEYEKEKSSPKKQRAPVSKAQQKNPVLQPGRAEGGKAQVILRPPSTSSSAGKPGGKEQGTQVEMGGEDQPRSARERLIRLLEEKKRQNPQPQGVEGGQQPQPTVNYRRSPEPVEGESKHAPQYQPGKTRILPGGISVQQQGQMRTYVPPARQKIIPNIRAVKNDTRNEDEAEPAGEAMQPSSGKTRVAMPAVSLVPKKLAAKPAPKEAPDLQIGDEAEDESAPKPSAMAKPAQREGEDNDAGRKMAQSKGRDLSSEAVLPPEEEDIEVPRPDSAEEGAPQPDQYEQAKEDFRRKIEDGEVKQNAKAEAEELLEQYARENLVWLYEIYKMGGISREDFLQKVREKTSESGAPAGQLEAPANPALAAIGKEIEKKNKK